MGVDSKLKRNDAAAHFKFLSTKKHAHATQKMKYDAEIIMHENYKKKKISSSSGETPTTKREKKTS